MSPSNSLSILWTTINIHFIFLIGFAQLTLPVCKLYLSILIKIYSDHLSFKISEAFVCAWFLVVNCLAAGDSSQTRSERQIFRSFSLKSCSRLPKKLFYLLQWKPFKNNLKMLLKIFHLKDLFVLKIFKFLSWLFYRVEKTAWKAER